jgi:hypothetical protein
MQLPLPYTKYHCATDIRIPAGEPPLRVKEIKKRTEAEPHLKAWSHNLRVHFLEIGQWLSNEAIIYFLQYEFEIDSPKWVAASKIIRALPDIERPTVANKKS